MGKEYILNLKMSTITEREMPPHPHPPNPSYITQVYWALGIAVITKRFVLTMFHFQNNNRPLARFQFPLPDRVEGSMLCDYHFPYRQKTEQI